MTQESCKKVQQSKPYGPDVKINKLECVGHIQKRLGTRLRKLRAEWKGRKLDNGKIISGRGRLTDVAITSMQNYFGMAIRQNAGKLYPMKKAVGAVLYHCSSLPVERRHQFCPSTADSWCKWQRDRVNNTQTYESKINLPPAIKSLIEPIFRDLSKDELLEKCLHGKTQNCNEAFNQVIWGRCPKQVYVGRKILELGVSSAVLSYNEGARGIFSVFQKLGISYGAFAEHISAQKDVQRQKYAEKKNTNDIKNQRKKLRAKRKGYQDTEREKEGGE